MDKDLQDALRTELEEIHTSEDWIQDTLKQVDLIQSREQIGEHRTVKKNTRRNSRKFVTQVAAAAAVITVVSVGSVFAYNTVQRSKNNDYQWKNTAAGLDVLQGAKENGAILKEANEVVQNKDITVTMGAYKAEKHRITASVVVTSTDGSALFEEDENKVASIARSGFYDIGIALDDGDYEKVRVNGAMQNSYNPNAKKQDRGLLIEGSEVRGRSCSMMPVSTETTPDRIVYQLVYDNYNVDTLEGRKVKFQFSNFGTDYTKFEDIQFTFDNIAAITDAGSLADASQFALHKATSNLSNDEYVLQPGSQHIVFSNAYPGCYIDNMGFYKTKSHRNTQAFYMTIVCDSAEAKEDLRKLTFQNDVSGASERYSISELEDGRIQLVYNVNADLTFSQTNDGVYFDTNKEHLSHLQLKGLAQSASIEMTNTDSIELALDVNDVAREIHSETPVVVTSTNNGEELTIQSIDIQSSMLKIEGRFSSVNNNSDPSKSFGFQNDFAPVAYLKNGKVVPATKKAYGGVGNSYTGNMNYSWGFDTIIEVSDIERIEWHGSVIYEQ